MLRTVRILLVGLNILNWLCVVAFAIVVALLVARVPAIEARLLRAFPDSLEAVRQFTIVALSAVMVVGVAAHVIFRKLIAIVDTVAQGAPFSAVNADRLRTIAWALLAIQLLDIVYGVSAINVSQATGEYFGWGFSLGGWLAVLLLFVLARVFRQGADMQDELAATV